MLVHPQFDPIALAIGPVAIRWYGLMYLIAFLGFFLLGRRRLRERYFRDTSGLAPHQVEDLLFFGVLGVVLGDGWGTCFSTSPLIIWGDRSRPWQSGKAGCRFTAGCLA